jgi:ribosomal protein L7/L12
MSTDYEWHKRVRELESKVAFLFEHLGLTYEPEPADRVPQEVIDLVRQGDKIGAIKALREAEQVDLAEAKALVEEIERQYKASSF